MASIMTKLSVLVFLFSANAYADLTDEILRNDTIESIAKRNISKVKIKYGTRFKDYEEDIQKWNPRILDWSHPPKNQFIYIDFPYDHYLQGSTWTPQLEKGSESFTEPDITVKEFEFSKRLNLNVFYATSFGTYKEITSNQEVSSGQNFPITLGLGGSFANEEKNHFITASFYWAMPSNGSVAGGNSESTTENFSTPGEVGYNLYYQFYYKERMLGIYTGYDFEKLNTFNTDELTFGSTVKNVENKIHYLTFGVTQGFSFFDLKMNLKASLSKTVSSSTNGAKNLTGVKYILYYTIKPEGRFSYNAFYKHHELKGPTDLSIDRIGLSVGMSLF